MVFYILLSTHPWRYIVIDELVQNLTPGAVLLPMSVSTQSLSLIVIDELVLTPGAVLLPTRLWRCIVTYSPLELYCYLLAPGAVMLPTHPWSCIVTY